MQWKLYKPGQGFYTRVGSAVAFGVVALALALHVHSKLRGGFFEKYWMLQLGIPLLVMAGAAYAIYWVCGLNPRTVDFMVATEGEMKKVNWSTRKEVVGATKVVIGLVLVMSLYTFVIDFVVSSLFKISWIGILQEMPPQIPQ